MAYTVSGTPCSCTAAHSILTPRPFGQESCGNPSNNRIFLFLSQEARPMRLRLIIHYDLHIIVYVSCLDSFVLYVYCTAGRYLWCILCAYPLSTSPQHARKSGACRSEIRANTVPMPDDPLSGRTTNYLAKSTYHLYISLIEPVLARPAIN
jgi:hypothetical protein